MSRTEDLQSAITAVDEEEVEQEPQGEPQGEQQVEQQVEAEPEPEPEPLPQPIVSPIKITNPNKPKGSYYQTQYASPREFDFRMSGAKAQGLACGPSSRGLLHHVVLPADHPAASPMLIEDAIALTTAKLLEAGVEVKMDNRMEQSMQSMIGSCLYSAKEPSLKMSQKSYKSSKPSDFIPNYERLIAALQTHPNLQKEPPKLEALRTLKDAVKNKTEIPGERFRKILEMCLELSYVDRNKALEFVNRMKNAKTLTEEQAVSVMKEADRKFVNGKIQLIELQRLIERCGMKGSKRT